MGRYKKFAFRGMIAGILAAAAIFVMGVLTATPVVQATDSGDCGPSSIITCGVKTVDDIITKYNTYNAQAAIMQTTYSHFGIGIDQLNQLKARVVEGIVYNDFYGGHDVIVVNGKVVAVNAVTAGRVNVPGSTEIGSFGDVHIYKRGYHFSNHSAKHAFILMDGEKFVFGILEECGNPVVGDTPDLAMNKEISRDGVNFAENASFAPGETATFRITARETTGKGLTTGTVVKDQLPAGFSYVPGSTKLNGAAVADITSTPVDLGNMNASETKTVTFQAKVNLVGKTCGSDHLTNTASIDSDQTPEKSDTASADVSSVCITTSCDALSGPATLTAGQTGVFTATASATGATVTGYEFSVDGAVAQALSGNPVFNYTSNTAGTHTVSVKVKFSNGSFIGGTGNCAKSVKVCEIPKQVECIALNGPSNLMVNEAGTFTTVVSDASLVDTYLFDLDGVKGGQSTSPTTQVSFGTAGTHTVSVTITPKSGVNAGRVMKCSKIVTVKKVEPKTVVCTSISGPETLAIGEVGTYTANTDHDDRVASYVWTGLKGDNGKTATVQFSEAGNYKISVTIVPKADAVLGGQAKCEKTVKVTENPVFRCDLLSVNPSAVTVGGKVTVTVKFTASNGASFKSAKVFFGNNETADVTTATNNSFSVDNIYTKDGEYTVTTELKFNLPGGTVETTSGNCEAKVVVTKVPVCEYNPNLPPNDVNCKPPVEKCKIPGKEQYNADDKVNCTAVLAKTLVNTGPGAGLAAMFVATSLIGAFLHDRFTVRG